MRTSDFAYPLPPEFIAQRPASPRDSSRLMVLDRNGGPLEHRLFRDLPEYLRPGDALVLNETRVIPARLHARKTPGGGRVELLLLRRLEPQIWEVLVGGRAVRPGRRLLVEGGPEAEVVEDLGGPRRSLRFAEPLGPRLEAIGEMPLPPYIHAPLQSPEEYQTVFARLPGSAAAPTAGLHFTPGLLDRIEALGVRLVRVTLHIGLDTFAPVSEDLAEDHAIHTEWCHLSEEAVQALSATRATGGRIVAVGTTSVRTLETAARAAPPGKAVAPFKGPTDLYILPGHRFRAVDAVLTNFHLPRSTLLMLVSAFAGRDRILAAYEAAKEQGYRFYSFGDAMLIV
ncbi:MAG: tRNA preQ1(34) S-adenosylmethionine ribosyltransferase-isomerase QueA [Chloroflexi bacterium]|nr:tRNA preQ1(34) S-adenosylmethionine ribosyltransferase-isomerase QueA [Chloroflexota bacterium]